MLLGGLAADLGIAAGAEAAGQLAADVQLDVRIAHQQGLGVGVDRDELDALEPGVDHPVHRIDATAPDADHLDDREIILRIAEPWVCYLQQRTAREDRCAKLNSVRKVLSGHKVTSGQIVELRTVSTST